MRLVVLPVAAMGILLLRVPKRLASAGKSRSRHPIAACKLIASGCSQRPMRWSSRISRRVQDPHQPVAVAKHSARCPVAGGVLGQGASCAAQHAMHEDGCSAVPEQRPSCCGCTCAVRGDKGDKPRAARGLAPKLASSACCRSRGCKQADTALEAHSKMAAAAPLSNTWLQGQ